MSIQGFDDWLATVDEFEPRMTLKDVDDALMIGQLDEKQAAGLRQRIEELGDDAEGESPAPRS